ncbi:MAG: 1-acyl-sn-glycerol-3-phosphate acyltransferase [Lachnospiraceae bacterium]|nr:1-acyl-sn-glycerol-3-phosphate acyltransferase [Lachnospiraceae bacterium]
MKINLRTILCLIYVALFLVLSMPVHLVVWLIGKKDAMKKYRISSKIIRWAYRSVLWIAGIKINIIGQENIPTDRACLFASNHRSNLDTILIQIACGVPIGFVAKTELKKVPLLGLWMQDIGCVFLDRSNIKAAIQVMNTGADHVKAGCSMGICPEGTRGHEDTMKDFKEGSFKIATKANAPIIPVAVIGTDDRWEKNPGIKLTKGYVTICFDKPIELADLDPETKKHIGIYVQGFVKQMYDSHKEDNISLNQA